MTRITSVFVGTALVVGLAAAPAFAQNSPAGSWDVVLESPQGAQSMTLEIKVTGDKSEGTVTTAMGAMPVTGTAKADSVVMSGNLEVQGMALPITLTANVVANDVNGSMKVGDFGEFPFKGTRSGTKATAAPAAAAAPADAAATAISGVGGKWNVTLVLTGMGEFPLTATLTQNGEDVAGMISSMAGEVAVKGTFKGSALNLEFTAETPQGPMKVTMTGELKDQSLTGKANIAGMGDADWKASR